MITWNKFRIAEDNIPLKKPGGYLATHILSGKKYVGISFDVELRLKEHAAGRGGSPKFERAIKKYGPEAFIVTPLFYIQDKDRNYLLDAETSLINIYDSLKNGYNIIEKNLRGGYGPEFSSCVAAAWKRPGVRERHTKTTSDPAWKRQRSEIAKEVFSRPEVKRILSKARKSWYTNPENRKKTAHKVSLSLSSPEAKIKHGTTSRVNRAKPEVKAKYIALRGKRITITDGCKEKSIPKDQEIPEGWYRGRCNSFKEIWTVTKDLTGYSSITLLNQSED
jgi:group I intron endonuclease